MKHFPLLDSRFDLVLERIVDVPRELVWRAWTTPEHLKEWFCPLPWKTIDCEIDLRPGGIFRTVMQSPEGENHSNLGCYLEVINNEKLVWTDVLHPGFRPASHLVSEGCPLFLTGMILLEDHGKGTKYTAICLHKDAEDKQRHADMGFEEGWGTALDQLVAHMKKIA
jgi:uncharacterized protein YndB with AHSA1/START domain